MGFSCIFPQLLNPSKYSTQLLWGSEHKAPIYEHTAPKMSTQLRALSSNEHTAPSNEHTAPSNEHTAPRAQSPRYLSEHPFDHKPEK